jgi:hypothetical protein
LERMLSGPVLLDGHAATLLSRRGFDAWMGIHAEEDDDFRCSFERFSSDRKINGSFAGVAGYSLRDAPSLARRLTPCAKGVRIGSWFVTTPFWQDVQEQRVGPALTLYENPRGGRAAVYAACLSATADMCFLNERRQAQLRRVLAWLGQAKMPAVVEDAPEAFVLLGRRHDADEFLLVVFNLSADPIEPLKVSLGTRPPRRVLCLSDGGRWQPVPFARQAGVTEIKAVLPIMRPGVFRLL